MIKKLLIVAVSGAMLALISIGAAIAIGGPDLRSAFHDGNFEWDSDEHKGPVATRNLEFNPDQPLTIEVPVVLEFTRGDAVSMTVSGRESTIDALEWKDGRLTLDEIKSFKSSGLTLKLVAPRLPPLEISAPVEIEIEGMDQPEFRLTFAGAGNVSASGKVDKLVVDASGAGNLDLEDLQAVDAEIDIAGLGNADISASGKVKASIAGAGNVTLHRKPRELDSDIAGLGNVEHDY